MKEFTDYERKLLDGWEEVYKKGQLTLWIMLALKDSPKHMNEIKDYIERVTEGVVSADDQSMYRALRRYHDAELVSYNTEPKNAAPDLKIYGLTDTGELVLAGFLERNIINLLYKPEVKQLIERIDDDEAYD